MPRYFFDIDHGDYFTYDLEGHECKSRKTVRDLAVIRMLPDIAGDEMPAESSHRVFRGKVRDKDGRYVLQVALSLEAEWLNENPEDGNPENPDALSTEEP